jgi:hypothetical protein
MKSVTTARSRAYGERASKSTFAIADSQTAGTALGVMACYGRRVAWHGAAWRGVPCRTR